MAKARLLVCDDEPEFADFIRRVAEPLGYEVESTADGFAFIQAYEREEPDAIVLDMVMPEIDGNELVGWLGEQGSTAHLVIMTGFSPDYAENAKRLAQFKGLPSVTALTKPVRLADLRAALRLPSTAGPPEPEAKSETGPETGPETGDE